MAVIKCKMCGGTLSVTPGATVAECDYCGSLQTIPQQDDEKKLTLFARANRLRAACEFDKAAGVFETIVADFPEEAEAYWGLVLCRYGIEYVDDPGTGKKIPTCHRSSFDSIMEDSDYEQTLENADVMARRVYREEARQIEELRKGIIAVSNNEPPYDIFICYKETDETGSRTLDSVLAQDVYEALTDKGYRVFFSRITLEDKLGMEYEPYIFAALNSAKIMLAFGTDYEYFNAVWVKNEWGRFLKLMEKDKQKHLIPCYKGIDAYDMPKEFARLQAQDMGKVGAVQDLLRGIGKLMPKQEQETVVVQTAMPNASAMVMRGQFALEDGDFNKASEYFERALDQNPQDGAAYLGKVLAALHLSKASQIDEYFIKLHDDKDYDRAIRFSDPATAQMLRDIRERAHKKYLVKCITSALKKHRAKLHQQEEKHKREEEAEERKVREEQLALKRKAEEEERIAQRKREAEERRYKLRGVNYNRAIKLLERGDKEEAYGLLKMLSGYKDADVLAETIRRDILSALLCVKLDSKWGYINEAGEMVIKPQFDDAESFGSNGLASVKQNGKWGYINEAGEMVIEPQFDDYGYFVANGLACVKHNGKWGYINLAGEMVIKPQFDDARGFDSNGLASVKQNGKWGYINEAGEMVIEPQFDDYEYFDYNGLAMVKLDGKRGYISEAGEMVIKPQFDYAYSFADNGLACVELDGKYGYINEAGEMVIQPQFDDAGDFEYNGLARVELDGKWGYINEAGEMVIKPQFDDAERFRSNGLASVKQNDKWGYINEAGEMVIQPQFDDAEYITYSGLALVKLDDKWGWVNEAGKMVIEPRFESKEYGFLIHGTIFCSKVECRKQLQEKAMQRAQQRARWRNSGKCQHCGGELKGLFGKKCTSCGKPKDY